jgi:glycosyltransferase involved in cell wall biosynthesis
MADGAVWSMGDSMRSVGEGASGLAALDLMETAILPPVRADDAPRPVRAVVPARPPRRARASLRVAIVHEWLSTYAGSERVLEQLLLCFPTADIFAVVDFLEPGERAFLQGRTVRTSFVQKLPFARRKFRHYLGLMPIAVQQFDLSGYDLIVSSNHAVAKGVLTGPDQVHVSYVHSPMRYAWDLQHQYLRQSKLERGLKSAFARWQLARLREWDVSTAHQVDHFLANSSYIARRIGKMYRRPATVIHPPVDLDRFDCKETGAREEFYLVASRFVPYKRVDLVAEAFARMPGRRLVVVGDGPDREQVAAIARGAPNIELAGRVSQEELVALMQRAKAFVFAAEEDFGIALVEAQACGTPVIAYGRGGATDIVVEAGERTGMLFDTQDAASLAAAVEAFEALPSPISAKACRANAMRFSEARFRAEIVGFVDNVLA